MVENKELDHLIKTYEKIWKSLAGAKPRIDSSDALVYLFSATGLFLKSIGHDAKLKELEEKIFKNLGKKGKSL